MKNNPSLPPVLAEPNENEIRNYAYHLYVQGNCAPGHDVDNWLEAAACLNAHIPEHSSHRRLHHHVHGPAVEGRHAVSA